MDVCEVQLEEYDMDGRPHPHVFITAILAYCIKSQTELPGVVGVSFCQNFATCAQSVLGSRFRCRYLLYLVLRRHTIPQALDRSRRPVSRLLAVHALHCQPKVQGTPSLVEPESVINPFPG